MLNPKIGPADPEKYKDIRDAKDWQNPYICVRTHDIQLRSKGMSSAPQTMPTTRLRESLLKLPIEAWPYGRVIAVQEVSIRSPGDDTLIANNKAKVDEVLKDLKVKIELWP